MGERQETQLPAAVEVQDTQEQMPRDLGRYEHDAGILCFVFAVFSVF